MLPIFDEYKNFIYEKTGLNLESGVYWYDKSIIKAFGTDGKLYKIYRLKIEDNLSMNYSKPKSYKVPQNVSLITWCQLIERRKNCIIGLEMQTLDTIKKYLDKYSEYEPIIPISTGKDSMCVLSMVRQIKPDVKAIFNNTSLDVADTYKMVKTIENCEIMNPDKGFYQYVESDNMIPTRFSRFCCRIFKTGVMVSKLDKNHKYLLFMGMRNDESNTRSGYGTEYKNTEWGKVSWQGILPIRQWNDVDVWLYILYKKLPINPKYKKGYTRVGCGIACPFYNKSTWILDEYYYPTMRKRWIDILEKDFIDNGKACILNCSKEEYLYKYWNGGMVRDEPTEEIIREFMEYKNIQDINIAKKYFNNTCQECGKKLKKDEVAISMKFHGRDTTTLFCKKCFMKNYNMDKEKYNWYIKRFKEDGCCLF